MNSTDGPPDPAPVQHAPTAEPELLDTIVAGAGAEAASERGPSSFSGYKLSEVLGRGGMGEVLLAEDLRIGRDVAIKRMRSEAPSPDAIFEQTWWIIDGALVTRPTALALDGTPAALGLIAANTVMIVVAAMFVRSHATTQRRAQRQLEIQAWHLGQLLPVDPPRAMPALAGAARSGACGTT